MANDMNADLLRQTREEILRRGNQQIQEYSDNMRKKQEISDAKTVAGRTGANSLAAGVAASFTHPTEQNDTAQPHPRTDREYGVEIAQLNTDIYYANRIITEYTNLRNGIGQSGDDEYDQSLRQQMDQLLADNGYSTLDEVKQKLESMQSQRWTLEQGRRYANLESNPDFAEYSKPSSLTPTAGFGIQVGKLWIGKGDPKYDYINNLGSAQELAAESRGQEDNVNPYGMYDVMEPEEVARYNYLYHTQGEKAADEYLEYLEYILSERKALLTQTASTALAEGHPFFSNGLSVISRLQSGVGLLDAALQGAGNSVVSAVTGEEKKPINYYRAAGPSIATSAIRGTRAQKIADKYGVIDINAEEHPVLAKVLNGKSLADLYQLGMSMVDSAAAAKLSPQLGKAGTFLLGGSAGTQAMLDAVEKGATDDQAITMGILSAAAEIIFESYEVENLLGSNSNILKSVANQALTEAIGEGATNISNTVSDILVMQDKSQFMQNVQKYMEQGMTKEQAQMEAFGDAAIAVGLDAIGGAVSGGLFGLAGPAVSGANDTNQNVETNQSSDFIVEEAEESGGAPAGNAASQVSQQTQQQATQQQTIQQQTAQQQSARPQAAQQQAQQTQQAQQATQQQESSGSSAVAAALNYFNENGRVSNSVADNILANPSAVQELQRSSGVKIPGIAEGATHSQKRSAVKSAIAQLAGTNPKVSTQGKMDSIMDALQDLNEGNTTPAPEKSGTDTDASVDAAIASGLRGEAYVAEPQTMDQRNLNPVNGEVEQDGGTASGIVESSEAEKSGSSGTREQNAQPSSAGSPVMDSSQQQGAKKGPRLENVKAGKDSATGNAKSNPTADNAGIKGTGAAERNFSGKADYQELLHEGNVQRDRPGDVRPMEVPKKDSYGRNVSEFVGNAYGADVTPDSMASEIEMLVQEGALGFDKTTNHESLKDAAKAIKKTGPLATMKSITSSVSNGKLRNGDIEKAMLLYARYANMDFEKNPDAKDYASELMVDLATMANMSGRNLQLFSLMRRMAPEGQLMTVQKTVQRSVDNLIRKGQVKKGYEPSIAPQLQEAYLKAARDAQKAKTPGEVEAAKKKLNEAENAILLSEAAKMPVTFRAKWNAWRYMAMLGNLKTQIRNVAGNAMYMPYKAGKDAIGAAMELAIPKDQRTKAILNLFTEADRNLLRWASVDGKSKQVQGALKYSAKLGDDVSGDVIRENMRIFNTEAMETIRKAVEWAPSFGDMIFKNRYYADSLAGFLKARGYTSSDLMSGKVSDAVLQEARSYAIQEAMKATFNDQNAFSDLIVNFRLKDEGNVFRKAANILGEGIMPFRRTPANIVVRAVDNSPASIVRGVANLATKVQNGQMSAATAIDQMASGLTGTGAALLGFALASGILGIKLRGSGTDDDEKRRGIQDYSIEFSIGGKDYSYTIDWAAPANLPLFVGANIYEAFNEREWDTSISAFSKVIYAMGDTLEPMLSLSCLSSLNDVFESARYAEDNRAVYTVLSQMAFSYFTQGVPALLRQTVQAAHQNKQTTFANNQDPLLREAERKIGGVALLGEFFRTDKTNQWGETEGAGGFLRRIVDAYFNPGTLKEIDNSELELEIQRLNGSQPESVSPPITAKAITYTDASGNRHENYRLTEEEYNTLQTVQGQTAYDILNEIISSDTYENLTDDQKVRAFHYVYDYARERGRMAAIDGYEGNLASWMEDIEGNEAGAVFRKIISADFADSFEGIVNGTQGAAESLQRAYDSYYDLPPQEQKAFREDAEGRVKWMINAGDAGIYAETFASMYQIYRGIDKRDLSVSQKANQWSYELQRAYERKEINMAQLNTLKRDMVFRYSGVVDTAKFDALVSSGFTADEAKRTFNLLDGLKPEEGYKTTRDIQRAEAIASSNLSDADKRAALYIYLNDAQDTNLREMLSMGFTPSDYVAAWRINDSTSGKGRKAAIINSYQEEFGVDYETAEEIYKIYN